MDLSVAVKQVGNLSTVTGAGAAGVAALKESQKAVPVGLSVIDGSTNYTPPPDNVNFFGWYVKRETANLVAVVIAGLAVFMAYRKNF